MTNHSGTTIINIPAGASVVGNVTHDFETYLLNTVLKTLHQLNPPKDSSNIVVMVLMLCFILVSIVIYFVKHRFLCRHTDGAQRDPA